MPLPQLLQSPAPTITPTFTTQPIVPKRSLASRFDVEPASLSLNKRIKTAPSTPVPSSNPLSDSDSDSMDIVEFAPTATTEKKKKKKSAFQKYTETIGQTAEELARRDQRMQRFAEINERGTPSRVDTPDFVRDAQIAASLVHLPSFSIPPCPPPSVL